MARKKKIAKVTRKVLGEDISKSLPKDVKREAAIALNVGTSNMHRDVVRSLNLVGKGKKRGRHTASAPGDPPAKDTGDLVVSVKFIPANVDAEKPEASVHTDSDHAAHMEYGTQTVAARPFLRPAMSVHMPRIRGLIQRAIKRAIKKSKKKAT